MKNITLLLFSLIPTIFFAQVSNITLDFSKSEYPISYNLKDSSKNNNTKLRFVKFGETINFIIKNVNTQLYSVTLNGENVTYSSDMPAALKLFTSASVPDEATPSIAEVKDIVINKDPISIAKSEEITKNAIQYIHKYNAFKKAVQNLEQIKNICLQLQSFSQNEIDDVNTVEIVKSKSKQLIQKFRNDENIFDEITVLKSEIDDAKLEEVEAYNDLPEITEVRAKKLDSAFVIINKKTATRNEMISVERLKNDDDVDLKLLKRTADLHTKADALMKQVNDFDYNPIAKTITKLYAAIKNASNYEVSSAPIQADGDEIDFTYKVLPKTNLDFASPTKQINATHLKIWVKGGCQFKFGVGIGMNTIGLLNSTYTLHTRDSIVDNITNNKVSQVELTRDKNKDWFIPNGVAYAHFLTRVAKFVSVGGSLGVNVDFKDVKSSGFNLGLTSAFGDKYSVAFTLGASFGVVDKLNGKYQANKLYKQAEVDATAITKSVFRAGLFFGISLNLTSTEARKQ